MSRVHWTWFVSSIAIFRYKSGPKKCELHRAERTLNSSESLDNLESICEAISVRVLYYTYSRAPERAFGSLVDHAVLERVPWRHTFCCLSLSSPRPE